MHRGVNPGVDKISSVARLDGDGARLLGFNSGGDRSFKAAGPVGIELVGPDTLDGCGRGKVLASLRAVRGLKVNARGGDG